MPERRYREVQSRSQVMLLPPCMDDYVSEHNPVRAIDAFVDTLDLQALGFRHTEEHCGAGQPAYDPGLLLKLYLYGYQHRVRSSRRLEAETHRNLEVIWLCQGAKPSYKTIADFRKDNLASLRATNREFALLCRELSLLGDSRVAIDGTFLKANANPGSIHTKARLERELKKLDERIAAYHRQLDEADAEPEDGADGGEDPELAAKIEAMVEKQKHKKALQERLQESGESQVSEVDPDARMMRKHGKLVGGYNCQIAVDDKHKLIVAEDVVQDGNDFGQYEPMMTKACEATGNSGLIGLADVGYYSGAQLKGCEDRGWMCMSRYRSNWAARAREIGSAAMISVTIPRTTRISVRPGSGWLEATRPPSSMTSCISFIVRCPRFVGVVRCRADAWKRRAKGAGWSAGSMRTGWTGIARR